MSCVPMQQIWRVVSYVGSTSSMRCWKLEILQAEEIQSYSWVWGLYRTVIEIRFYFSVFIGFFGPGSGNQK